MVSPSLIQCQAWRKNKLVNPLTNRKISEGGPVYKQLQKECKLLPSPKKPSPKKQSPKKQSPKKQSPKKQSVKSLLLKSKFLKALKSL